ncbi:MAG TPA: 4Fe-4S dicluster domain-containing protein [Myxococcota bacterium]|nr:4Fe-4S dicluster domain-containing protein [Myxococcota bacterium]
MLAETVKTLVVKPTKCVGCRTCEVACTFAHSSAGWLGHSRIKVHAVAPERFVQITCMQCIKAACIKVCPTEALVRNPGTRAVELIEERCIGCGLCEVACPFGHMFFSAETRRPIKCDLCGGQPACAMFCPHGALEWR